MSRTKPDRVLRLVGGLVGLTAGLMFVLVHLDDPTAWQPVTTVMQYREPPQPEITATLTVNVLDTWRYTRTTQDRSELEFEGFFASALYPSAVVALAVIGGMVVVPRLGCLFRRRPCEGQC